MSLNSVGALLRRRFEQKIVFENERIGFLRAKNGTSTPVHIHEQMSTYVDICEKQYQLG